MLQQTQLKNSLMRIANDLQSTSDMLAREGNITLWGKCQRTIAYILVKVEQLEKIENKMLQLQRK